MRKIIVALVAAATLAAGGVAFAVLNPFDGAGADSTPPTTAAAQPTQPGAGPAAGKRGDAIKGVLDDLVAKGTITAQQRDAIVDAFKAKLQQMGGGKGGPGGRPGGFRGRLANRAELGQAVAGVLGITPQDLRTQLKDGKSIADIAASKNIPLKQVTDKLTADVDARIDKAVSAGKLDPAKAATLKTKVPQMVDKIVNHKR
jgi:hypothetical protein